MIESLIAAEKECTKREDVNPAKVLRPIGTIMKEWTDCPFSTDLPHWIYWRIKGYLNSYRGRHGDTLFFERMEEIESLNSDEIENAS